MDESVLRTCVSVCIYIYIYKENVGTTQVQHTKYTLCFSFNSLCCSIIQCYVYLTKLPQHNSMSLFAVRQMCVH